MNGKALGIIETIGLVPAVEAADVAVKSANVTLQGCRYVGAGLVSVLMTGDVSSVKSSVDAGKMAAERLGTVQSSTVIARTAEGLEDILTEPEKMMADEQSAPVISVTEVVEEVIQPAPEPEVAEEVIQPAPENEVAEEVIQSAPEPEVAEEVIQSAPEPEVAAPVRKEAPKDPSKAENPRYEVSQLKKMNVSKLRRIARSFDGLSIARKEIKFARKRELIEAIMNAYRQEEE